MGLTICFYFHDMLSLSLFSSFGCKGCTSRYVSIMLRVCVHYVICVCVYIYIYILATGNSFRKNNSSVSVIKEKEIKPYHAMREKLLQKAWYRFEEMWSAWIDE